jgi:hypothetical protein
VGEVAGGEVVADRVGGRGGGRVRLKVCVAGGWGFLWLSTIEEEWDSQRTGGGGGAAGGEGKATR